MYVRGSWRPNVTAIYWPPLLWPSALCLSRSPGLLNRRPRGPLCWVRAFSTAYCHQRVSKHHRGSREWLSLPHLISNFSGPPLIRGSKGPFGLVWPSLPHLVYNSSVLQLQLSDFLSWPSYIIVQHPLNRPLNLWNGMFDRHQAEITVMQFRGHSLPVHQSIAAQWDLHLVPYYQPNSPARFPHITTIGMCHFLPVHHFEWYFWPGRRSKYNNMCYMCVCFQLVAFVREHRWHKALLMGYSVGFELTLVCS